jgi:hypothetical protein
VSVTLDETGGSGKSGSASIRQDAADLIVDIVLAPSEPTDDHPVHIHSGLCGTGAPISHNLTNIVDGMSSTILTAVALDEVADGAHSITVHESAANLQNVIACGDIPEAVP